MEKFDLYHEIHRIFNIVPRDDTYSPEIQCGECKWRGDWADAQEFTFTWNREGADRPRTESVCPACTSDDLSEIDYEPIIDEVTK